MNPYENHDMFVYHFGRKSGKDYKKSSVYKAFKRSSRYSKIEFMQTTNGKTPIILDTPALACATTQGYPETTIWSKPNLPLQEVAG